MKATELIKELQALVEEYGDLPVYREFFAYSDWDKRNPPCLSLKRNDLGEVIDIVV